MELEWKFVSIKTLGVSVQGKLFFLAHFLVTIFSRHVKAIVI